MKNIEQEVLQTLKGEVDFLLSQALELDRRLLGNISRVGKRECLITAAYDLSGVYSCLEDVFAKIAKVFENRIENPASWHKELLERMRIAVPSIRPAILAEKSFGILNELRAFRHVFRSSYVFSLDRERLLSVASKWKKNRRLILKDVQHFLHQIGCR